MEKSECVKVCLRCRPLSEGEVADGRKRVVIMDKKNGTVFVKRPSADGVEGKDFTFDAVYDQDTTNSELYETSGYIIVESVVDGYNGTVFAYGQTGTGKTHTMSGTQDDPGVTPRSFEHIFKHISASSTNNQKQFLVRVSFLEIYNEEIRDLLSKNPKSKLDLKDHPDHGVYVRDLTTFVVKSMDETMQVMEAGSRNRSVGQTLMNHESSRSHSIFSVTVETCEIGSDGENHIRVGKLNMVDLAGSERQSKTGSTGETLKEATKINLSLSALGNVISALVSTANKVGFVPYRDSKLTRLLQDSLGGNTKTVMVANVGPADYNYDETMSTLRYAYRAKSIQNKPRINEDPKDAMIREFQEEIHRLKAELANRGPAGNDGTVTQEVEERIVEKVVEVEKEIIVDTGISADDLKAIEGRMQKERDSIKAKLEKEKKKLAEQKDLADAEREELLGKLEEKQRAAEAQNAEQADMLSKLKAMEEKMLVGSQVMEKALAQEMELRRQQAELSERERGEKRMVDMLKREEDEKLDLEERFISIEDQVLKLKMKLEKLWGRYKTATNEIQELQEQCQREREDILDTIREFQKEAKLKSLIIDMFIPIDERFRIEDRTTWDEELNKPTVYRLHTAGNNQKRNGRKGGPSPKSRLDEHDWTETPLMRNAYYVYTDDGGVARAEDLPQKRRVKDKRPNTASRKGRSNKVNVVNDDPFLIPKAEEPNEQKELFPRARGLVRG
eukprot:GEMP01013296.1.p1 GENE.GEMP01013296.1~~GEMP01013296.1.p1  ORF type:complete len:730 (+),score=153.45 GEMP01013296.1:191-2380(+)